MVTKNIIDQLLRAGNDLVQANGKMTNQSQTQLGDGLSSLLGGKGGAALVGGAIGLMLGSKSGRKMGSKVLTYGGLAALGTIAYKAYQNYQSQTAENGRNPIQPFEKLPAAEFEVHGQAILIALIAAAKSDGHIDDHEQRLIDSEVSKISNDLAFQQWFDRELKKPLDPAEVAKHATNEAVAVEMYLASVLAIDQQSFMEKSYLDELARQLKIPPALQSELVLQSQRAALAMTN